MDYEIILIQSSELIFTPAVGDMEDLVGGYASPCGTGKCCERCPVLLRPGPISLSLFSTVLPYLSCCGKTLAGKFIPTPACEPNTPSRYDAW